MANRRQRQAWKHCAQQVRTLCADPTLALWQQASQAALVYKGVALDGLAAKHRHRVYRALGDVNEILARYPIETWEDYQKISPQELKQIINHFKSFGELKI